MVRYGHKQFFVFLMDKERRLTGSFPKSRVLFRGNKIINAQNTSIKTHPFGSCQKSCKKSPDRRSYDSTNLTSPRTSQDSCNYLNLFVSSTTIDLQIAVIIRFNASSILQRKSNALREIHFDGRQTIFFRSTQTSVIFIFFLLSYLFARVTSILSGIYDIERTKNIPRQLEL